MAAAQQVHPVRLVVTDDLHRSRLTVFFRLLLSIPHFFWLGLFTVGAVFVAVLNWFTTLFMGRSPKGLHDFLAGYVRYATQFFAYLFLAANPFPPFYVGTDLSSYPIDVEIDPPARQSRWVTGFRLFLAFPALLLSSTLFGAGSSSNSGVQSSGGIGGLAAVFGWFSALARGRSPRGLRDFIAWGIGYTAQAYAYLFLLTDRYPDSNPVIFLGGGLEPPDAEGRARAVNADDLRRSRLSVFFRLLLALPHLVWLVLWSVAALLAGMANWVVTLVTGRPAGALARFLSAFVRYSAHVNAFLYVVANPFPGFVGAEGSYPVDVRIAEPGRQNRWITLFRIFLALPAVTLNWALSWLLFVVGILVWFVAIVLGRAPAGLQATGVYAIGYSAQVSCYLFALTDRYPHSSPLAVIETS
jgi:hypothetical protein